MAFRTAYRLPRTAPSAAHMAGQVGLGSARTFASGPASNVYISNVPIGFRALVKLVDRDDEYGCTLPRPHRYSPYRREQRRRSLRAATLRRHSIDSRSIASYGSHVEASIDSALLSGVSTQSHFSHYFPFRSRTSAFVPIPICPEELVTPGKTTILSLPLSPDLHALLRPTPLMSYEQAEVGASVMANLCQGLLTMEEAFDMYRQACLYPLLTHLLSLDVLREGVDARPARTEGEPILDLEGRPDVLRLMFYERSAEDVRKILANTLQPNERGEEWWTLVEMDRANASLTAAESAEILEDWSETPAPRPALPPIPEMEGSTIDLVMPTLDVPDAPPTPLLAADWSDLESSPRSTTLPTPASEFDSPTSLPSDGFSTPMSDDSFPVSLTSSLLSQLGESTTSSWHIQPSEDDIEVESTVSFSEGPNGEEGSEVWSVADIHEISRPSSPSQFARWSGTSQGFGLAQPW